MTDLKNIAVLCPVANTIEPRTQAALGELVNRGYVVRTLRGCSQVDLARSSMASDALRDGFRETFWIDSDTDFNPDDIERIRAHNRPFTAGLYVKKGKPEFAGKFRAGFREATFGVGGGLLEMEYVGFGFCHVRAEVYEAIAKKFNLPACVGGYDPAKTITPYFLPMLVSEDAGTCYLSEDYSFCRRAKEAGYSVLADTRIKLGHVSGSYVYTWDDLAERQKYESMQLRLGPATEQADVSNRGEPDMIVQSELINELASLATQKADALALVHRIEGAEQVVRHLLEKSAQADQAARVQPPAEPSSEIPNTGPRPEVVAALNGEAKQD